MYFCDPGVRLLHCNWMPSLRSWDFDLNAPHWRLYWNSAPGGSVILGHREIPLGPDRLVLIPANTPCRSRLQRTCGHLFIHFLVQPPLNRVPANVYSFPLPSGLRSIPKTLCRWVAAGQTAMPRTTAELLTLLHYCLARIPPGDLPRDWADQRIAAALEALDDPDCALLSNAELASRTHLAVNAFIRLFQATVGVSPQAYAR